MIQQKADLVRRWRRRRRQLYELSRMAPHEVAELGVSRAALEFELSRPSAGRHRPRRHAAASWLRPAMAAALALIGTLLAGR